MENGAAPQNLQVLPTLLTDPQLRDVHASLTSEHDIRLRHDQGQGKERQANGHI